MLTIVPFFQMVSPEDIAAREKRIAFLGARTGASVLPLCIRGVRRAGIDDLRLTNPVSPVYR